MTDYAKNLGKPWNPSLLKGEECQAMMPNCIDN